MKNGNTEQFLDTGWMNEAEIYYHDFIYWCEGFVDENGKWHFSIRKWKVITNDHRTYVNAYDQNGNLIGYDDSFKIEAFDEGTLRETFLKSPVFDGKTFWEVEKNLEWLEAYGYPNGPAAKPRVK